MEQAEAQSLFLNTTNELREKVSRGTKYDLIKSAGLLRQLLIDSGQPLLDQINRTYRIPIKFEVKQWPEANAQPGLFHLMSPTPDDNMPKILVKRDQLLHQVCLLLHEHTYRVIDIIKLVAHIRGGIHSGDAETDPQRALTSNEILSLKLGFAGGAEPESTDVSIALIRPIAGVVLGGLQPLIDRISGKSQGNS